MTRRAAVLAVVLLAGVALAGCADDAPAASGERVSPGADRGPGGTTTIPQQPPIRKATNERWHFHDYWHGNATITLLDVTTELNATAGDDGLPALSSLVRFPQGTIVPPETGLLTVNVSWEGAGGALNLTYRPADSNAFFAAADLANGGGAEIPVTESMADVPHRQESLWAFNFTAKPGGEPPALPAKAFRVVVNATIGRPLFIDPPHLNWWLPGDVLPLVTGVAGRIDTATTPAGNLTLPGQPAGVTRPSSLVASYRVPATEGRIVPEGAKSLVVLLNFTSELPDKKLAVRYREANTPSEGPLTLAADGGGYRIYTLAVDPDMTDTTYSNRTTWEFQVVPDGDGATAFRGEFTLYAWVSRLPEAEAVAATVGTG